MKHALTWLLPLCFFTFGLLVELPLLNNIELKSIDTRFRLRDPIPPSGEVVVVAIDEKSLHQQGRWPWARTKIAELIQKIDEAKPTAIGLDIIFAEPSSEDANLIRTLSKTETTLLGYYFYQNQSELIHSGMSETDLARSFATILPSSLPQLTSQAFNFREMSGAVANLPKIAEAATSQGYFNTLPDNDGVIRQTPLFLSYRQQAFPSLALKLYSFYQEGYDPIPIFDETQHLLGVNLKDEFIPTSPDAMFWINYLGEEQSLSVVSANDILENQHRAQDLAGKIVLVGATAIGIYDLRVTPLSPVTPGVFVQAQIIDTLIRQDYLTNNEWTLLISLVAMLLMTGIIYYALSKYRLLIGLAITVGVLVLYVSFVFAAFAKGYVLALTYPVLNGGTIAFIKTAIRGLTEEFEKRKIRKVFQSYLHPDVIEEVIHDPEKLKLGGHKVSCTILFSDVRNFTTISEKMDAEVLVDLMNEYFDPIAQEIINAGGYIDKFIGDAVMAIFGVPKENTNHALQACQAALAMEKKAAELEQVFQQKYHIENFRIGIGIHSGDVVVGNIGTSERLNYTVMGDAVNLASRLEGQTKNLGATIVISEATNQAVKDKFNTKYLDEIHVKGKEQAIKVYELKTKRED